MNDKCSDTETPNELHPDIVNRRRSMSCCSKCEICGKRIKIGAMDWHIKETHKNKEDTLTLNKMLKWTNYLNEERDNYPNMPIIVSPHLTEKILKKICKSKKKRIIKKWLKNPKNYIIQPMKKFIIVAGKIVVHPSMYNKLKILFDLENKEI